jgi:tetratricopeptide (TPR) repeat protein
MLWPRTLHAVGNHGRALLLSSCCAVLLLSPTVAAVRAQNPDDFQKQLKDALDLYEKGRYIDAYPLFLHLDEVQPANVVVKAHLCFTLYAQTAIKNDPQEATQIRVRTRKCLLEAKALGDRSNLVQVMIDAIPEDGGGPSYSNREDVDSAMKSGESAFANGDLEQAVQSYQLAFLLDPKQYYAALFMGDVHYRRKEVDQAGIWFARAIAIDPDNETAYRYWGDTLAQSQKYAEAVQQYIDAIVAQPYLRQSWSGLIEFANRRRVRLMQQHIASPDSHDSDGNRTNITIDASTLNKKDGTSSWMLYEMSRAQWHGDKFKKEYPAESEYRHSLKEEVESLGLVASSVDEKVKSNTITNLDPTLATLLKLRREGLIEAYVLISAADDGIAKDYPAYRAGHRELIHRYIAEYVAAPLAPNP